MGPSTVAALHQGAPGQMTWLEDPPPWLMTWLEHPPHGSAVPIVKTYQKMR